MNWCSAIGPRDQLIAGARAQQTFFLRNLSFDDLNTRSKPGSVNTTITIPRIPRFPNELVDKRDIIAVAFGLKLRQPPYTSSGFSAGCSHWTSAVQEAVSQTIKIRTRKIKTMLALWRLGCRRQAGINAPTFAGGLWQRGSVPPAAALL